MTDDDFKLTRRRILAGVGTVGAASVGAGLGTTAYFSDTEDFLGNQLSAGELDLKLDYNATYAGGTGRLAEVDSWYSEDGPGEPFDVEEVEDGVYLIGQVPDPGDYIGGWEEAVQDWDFCDPEANLVNGDEIPVFTLEDVKPGDSGEVTISLHVCDNPAWLWMNGELTENAENGYSEPEPDNQEDGDANDPGDPDGTGELADAIQTTVWYDENCNNVFEPGDGGDGPVCVELVLDASGSMAGDRNENTISGATDLADKILNDGHEDNEVGVTFFSADGYDTGAQVEQSLTGDYDDVEDTIADLPSNGDYTAIGEGIATGQGDLENCEHDNRVMVVLTDGENNAGQDPGDAGDDAKAAGTEIFAIGVGNATEAQLSEYASEPDEDYVFIGADDDAIEQIFAQVAEVITGEQVLLEGTLAEVMADLEEGVELDGNRTTEEREPFAPAMTQCLGFEWEVPTDVGNEIQTDSVMFDVGFYAEQSRHNEDPEDPFDDGTTTTA